MMASAQQTFCYNGILLKANTENICFPTILIASVYKISENYYLLALLEECKYAKETIKSMC